MNSFEWNKIIGAVLGTLLLVMGGGFLAEAIYEPIEDRGPGYDLPENAVPGSGEGDVETVIEVTPLATLLASASSENGSRVARKCQACHTFEPGGGNKVGPALFGVVGASVAANDSFGYSDTLTQLGADGAVWTYEDLNEFLTAPKAFAPGTKMSFAGLGKEGDRADLLAFLQTVSANPIEFPALENEGTADSSEPVVEEEEAPAVSEPVAQVTTGSDATDDGLSVFEARLASASVDEGARVSRKCQGCHNFGQGEGNKFGPVLFDIVGAEIAANQSYSYSDILVQMGAEGQTWTFEALDAYLAKPDDFAPGTKMPFAGMPKEEDRANLLAYLRTLSANPVDIGGASEAAPVDVQPVVEEPATESVSEAAPTDEASAFSALLANASADEGALVSRKCQGCHNFGQGEGNKFGPVLYDIVGAAVASNATFSYSDTLLTMGDEGKAWTFEMLDGFITAPGTFAPGTKMPFAGLTDDQDRANLLAYLRTLSPNPVPLP